MTSMLLRRGVGTPCRTRLISTRRSSGAARARLIKMQHRLTTAVCGIAVLAGELTVNGSIYQARLHARVLCRRAEARTRTDEPMIRRN